MAQYNISVSGNQLIIELIVTGGDFAPSIVSIKNPSIKLTTDRIKFYDSGVYNMALFFNQINEIDGVAPTDLEDATDKIIALIANFNGGGAAPYKVFTALLTQSGTDAPVATVLENTLGDIVWSRDVNGFYVGTLSNSFPNEKTFCLIQNNYQSSGTQNYIYRSNNSEINVETIVSGVSTDSELYQTSIEIRTYN